MNFAVGDRVWTPDGIGTVVETAQAPLLGVRRDNMPTWMSPAPEGWFEDEVVKATEKQEE